jgi:hypothetical protein
MAGDLEDEFLLIDGSQAGQARKPGIFREGKL